MHSRRLDGMQQRHETGNDAVGRLAPLVAQMYTRFSVDNFAQSQIMASMTDGMPQLWPQSLQTVPGDSFSGRSLFQGACEWIKANPARFETWTAAPSSKNPFFTRGGALDLGGGSSAVISSTRFEGNGVRDADQRSFGGAIFAGDETTIHVNGCLFTRNSVIGSGVLGGGGAIRVDVGGKLWMENTTCEKNTVAFGSEASGGAISSAGSVTLASEVIFNANRVSGKGQSSGGAIAASTDSTLVAIDGAQFTGNSVCRRVARSLYTVGYASRPSRPCTLQRYQFSGWRRDGAILTLTLLQATGTNPSGGALWFHGPKDALMAQAVLHGNWVSVS